jgi:hypothetical protein
MVNHRELLCESHGGCRVELKNLPDMTALALDRGTKDSAALLELATNKLPN